MGTALPIDESRLYTAEEFADLQLPDGHRYELADGKIVVMDFPQAPHSYVASLVYLALAMHLQRFGGGDVWFEAGVVTRRGPDSVRGPDVAFYAKGRVPRPVPSKGYAPVPDLAIEVLSPSNRPGEVRRKINEYLSAGVRAVWVIDTNKRTVSVHLPQALPVVLTEADTLDGGDIVPGFQHPIAALFADLG